MRRLVIGALGLALATAATAAEFKVELGSPQGKVLRGRNGLHAADSRTERTLVRVISPGSDIGKRGTVRVLVMNLGVAPFEFGPANVRLELGDGSTLPPVPMAEFNRGRALVARESARAASVDRRVKGDLASLAQAGSGATPRNMGVPSSGPSSSAGDAASRQDRNSDADMLPGAKLLGALDGLLRRNRVGPQEAAGGYLVFDIPKPVRETAADQPLTVVVTAGPDVHRFEGRLRKQ